MEIEIMENNQNEISILEQEIPVGGVFKPISKVIEERVAQETEERLNTEKFKSKYEDPSSQFAQLQVNSYMKLIRPRGEEEFVKLKEVVTEDELDDTKVVENIDYPNYQSLQNGVGEINIKKEDLSTIRGIFAKANIRLNQKLKASVTSTDLYNMLYSELSEKRMSDYQYLVWQLS